MKYTSLISAIAVLTVIFATCFCLVFAVVSFNALDAAAEENIGPSFDCDKASTPTEYAICASDDLSALDRKLSAAYKAVKGGLEKGSEAAMTLGTEQRQWNKERSSTCGDDVACLSRMYQERILAVDWEVGGVGGLFDHDYALDALAIPYIKDKTVREIALRGYWCGTPVAGYLSNHEKPSEEFLKARAKILEANIKSGSNFWVATGL